MASQLFEVGKLINVDGTELELLAAPDVGEGRFVYSFRVKSEVDAERMAAATDADSAQPTNQPQPIEEETQHVR